ncbi:MAG: tetratricopeptide repeat protein [Isosphaeraceae bacterium]
MSVFSKRVCIALLALFVTCVPARAIDNAPVKGKTTLKAGDKPKVENARKVVQKTPELVLLDGNTRIVPSRVGLVYRIERAVRDQILISLPSQGLLGWVPRDSVVEYNQAEAYFTTELDLNPETSFAYLMRAIVCQDSNRLDRTFADLDQAIRLDPRNVSAWIERAFLWQLRNRMDFAMADVTRAIQVDPRAVDAYVERGVFHYSLKQYKEAFSDLDRAAELGSRSIFVSLTRGQILLERKDLDEAEPEFRRAALIDPKNPDPSLSIGTIQLMRSQPVEAIKTFSHAVQLDPDKSDAYSGRASAYIALGQHKAALVDLNNAIRIDPAHAENYRNRGTVSSYLGDWNQALADVETAVRLAPNDNESQLVRAWMLATCPDAKLRDGKKAVASATRACELTQWKVAHPMAALAAAYAESGDFKNALKWQEKAIELSPAKDPAIRTYRIALERYREKKPYHKLGVLEEWGIRKYQPATKSSEPTPDPKSTSRASNQP